MSPLKQQKTRGILNPNAIGERFQLSRPMPSTDLAQFIENYWIVTWNLKNMPFYRSETLPFPSVHIAIEKGRPDLYGVVTNKFSRRLYGAGKVFGVKFRPAMFYPFFGAPVSQLTDCRIRLASVFGHDGHELRKEILLQTNDATRVQVFEDFLRKRRPKKETRSMELRDIVEKIGHDRSLVRVEQIAKLVGMSVRSLQLDFDKYVGVSPKWVLLRYRLSEAADELANNDSDSLADLASRLGYFDQAHFIKDFKNVIGKTPSSYKRLCRR